MESSRRWECQQTAGREFSYYRKQPAISRGHGGRQHIIKLLSSESTASADHALSRHQTPTGSSLDVMINTRQAHLMLNY